MIMNEFIRKLKKYGVKRAFVYIFIRFYITPKKYIFIWLFSNNEADFFMRSLFQPTQLLGKGIIRIGKTSQIGVWPSPELLSGYAYIEARSEQAKIVIGENNFINNSATIIADKSSIVIGNNCLIGQNVNIYDSDFHGLELQDRKVGRYECSPVKIGDNVFIGANVTILKGVSIGCGSVIANGAVVITNVDPFSVVAGVPAKKIRTLKSEL